MQFEKDFVTKMHHAVYLSLIYINLHPIQVYLRPLKPVRYLFTHLVSINTTSNLHLSLLYSSPFKNDLSLFKSTSNQFKSISNL